MSERPIEPAVSSAAAERDGRSTRWDPHRQQRRLAIITAAIEAIAEFGPDASTAQIADRAGVPRTHVYRHFEGKQALDVAVASHVAKEIGRQIRAGLATVGSARDIISGAINQHLSWIAAHPSLYRFLAQHAYVVRFTDAPAVHDAKAAFAAELTALLQRYMTTLGVDTEPAERVIVGVVGLVDATGAWWLERQVPPRERLTAELTEQVWLIIDRSARDLGLALAADTPLPVLPTS